MGSCTFLAVCSWSLALVRVIGIDPGTKALGWAIIDDGGASIGGSKLVKVASGVLLSRRTDTINEKIYSMCNALSEKITEFSPIEASVERVFINKNPESSMNLVQLRGAIIYILYKAGISVFEYSPTEVKKSISTSGHSSKDFISSLLSAQGMAASSHDESDAIAIALCHKHNTPHPQISNKIAKR